MSYYSKGHNIDEEADDFDEYDPTPYGGGYDIYITYGHPLPPSDDICHPPSQNYDPVEYTSSSYCDVSSAYDNDDALNIEYSSYTRYDDGSGRNTSQDEEEQPDQAERIEFEEPSYQVGELQEEMSQGYGRSEEYGSGRKKYSADNYGDEEDEEKEHHHRTYYDD